MNVVRNTYILSRKDTGINDAELAYTTLICVLVDGLEFEPEETGTPGNREYYFDSSGGSLTFALENIDLPVIATVIYKI